MGNSSSSNSSIEKELLEVERQYWRAMKDGDAELAARLSDDSCIVTGAQGVGSLDRATLKKMFETATWKLEAFEITNAVARSLSDDVAVIAYQVHEKVTVEGKTLTFDAADCSTWVRRDGRWVCAVHTESLAGDPFGRDLQR
jgi:hypothetical protein